MLSLRQTRVACVPLSWAAPSPVNVSPSGSNTPPRHPCCQEVFRQKFAMMPKFGMALLLNAFAGIGIDTFIAELGGALVCLLAEKAGEVVWVFEAKLNGDFLDGQFGIGEQVSGAGDTPGQDVAPWRDTCGPAEFSGEVGAGEATCGSHPGDAVRFIIGQSIFDAVVAELACAGLVT